MLQDSFRKELERLQKQLKILPPGVDETEEECNSFVLVSKPDGAVWLCLDPAGLNKAVIRPVHRGPTTNV